MSTYTPNNLCVYVYAQAGYMGGLIAARGQPTDPTENDYNDSANRADAFAQAIDTAWGVGSYTQADLLQIQSAAMAFTASGRSIVPGSAGLALAGYTGPATAIVAGVQAGTRQIVAEGINPNGCSSGGGGAGTSFYYGQHGNLVTIGPSTTPVVFDAPAYTPQTTGIALVLVAMQVQASNTGDEVSFQPRTAGVATGVPMENASGTVDNSASTFNLIPITQGTPIVLGVQASNVTGGGHTLTCQAGHALVLVIELQIP